MEENNFFITVNHIDDYMPVITLKPGDVLILKKDTNNPYDDEAIAVYDKQKCKVGYVANSVSTVARGTYSAGRAYDRIKDENECTICFVMNEEGIAIAIVQS